MASERKSELELLHALGELIVWFQNAENWMKKFVGVLLDIKDEKLCKIVTSDMPFQPLWHVLMSLYRYREEDKSSVKQFEKLLWTIEQLEKKRNKLIHSGWFSSPSGIIQVKSTAKFRNGLNVVEEAYDISKIKDISKQLKKATQELVLKFYYGWLAGHAPELADRIYYKKVYEKSQETKTKET